MTAGTCSASPVTDPVMGTLIRRGAVAGALAGVAVGVFHLLISEPVIDQAIALEGPISDPLVSRGMQQVGLVAGTLLYGLAFGCIFAVLYGALGTRLRSTTVWERSTKLAAVVFLSVWFVPFLKYPANPPAVGDPDTIRSRTAWYLATIAISVVLVGAAWLASRFLDQRGMPAHVRQTTVAIGYVLSVFVLVVVLPAAADPGSIPAEILWSSRIRAVAGQLLLWGVVGGAFAALTMRSDSLQARQA